MMLVFFFLLSLSFAHDLEYNSFREGSCIVVKFYFPTGGSFSYESYQVFGPEKDKPFQVGRTDALGRIIFCPDKPGRWTIRTFSEDGHGAVVDLDVEDGKLQQQGGKLSIYQKLLVGFGVILGIFGLVEIYLRRVLPWLKGQL